MNIIFNNSHPLSYPSIPSVTVDQLNHAYFKIKVEIDFCVQFVSTDTDRNIWFYNIIGEVF